MEADEGDCTLEVEDYLFKPRLHPPMIHWLIFFRSPVSDSGDLLLWVDVHGALSVNICLANLNQIWCVAFVA